MLSQHDKACLRYNHAASGSKRLSAVEAALLVQARLIQWICASVRDIMQLASVLMAGQEVSVARPGWGARF